MNARIMLPHELLKPKRSASAQPSVAKAEQSCWRVPIERKVDGIAGQSVGRGGEAGHRLTLGGS